MEPNKYQSAIVDWVKTGRGHAAVSAVAGSGKTSTLVKLVAPQLTGRALFVAFNKSIATELGERLRGTPVQASTIHSAGLRALSASHLWPSRPAIDGKKVGTLARELVRAVADGVYPASPACRSFAKDRRTRPTLVSFLVKAYNLVRLTMLVDADRALVSVELSDLLDVLDHYDCSCGELDPTDWEPLLAEVDQRSMALAQQGRIDFTDMVWLSAMGEVPGVGPVQLPTYDWVLVDEAQDLNACQMTFVKRLLRPGGRMLVVGDPRQAIYGFAGADNKAFDALVEALNATVLPLSVCYRCPASHIKLAREDVPEIEAAEGAPEGTLDNGLGLTQLVDRVQEGDLVLCRTTAPLVTQAFAAIREGIPATVKGRDIGQGLLRMIRTAREQVGARAGLDAVVSALKKETNKQIEKLSAQEGRESQAMALADKLETICVVAGHHQTVREVEEFISSLFRDDRGSVTFATIHRAKGLEAERVHLLHPELLPHPMASKDWQVEQEINLRYVARTRAKQSLSIYHP